MCPASTEQRYARAGVLAGAELRGANSSGARLFQSFHDLAKSNGRVADESDGGKITRYCGIVSEVLDLAWLRSEFKRAMLERDFR